MRTLTSVSGNFSDLAYRRCGLIRLLIVLLGLGLCLYLLLGGRGGGERQETLYQPSLDKADNVEQQIFEDARRKMEAAEAQSR